MVFVTSKIVGNPSIKLYISGTADKPYNDTVIYSSLMNTVNLIDKENLINSLTANFKLNTASREIFKHKSTLYFLQK